MDYKWMLFSLEGRLNRQPFWLYMLAMLVLISVVQTLTGSLDDPTPSGATTLIALLLLWPNIAVQVKRWHDTDRSGWWILIGLVPIIGAIWAFIVTGFFSGTKGDNRFGPDPLA